MLNQRKAEQLLHTLGTLALFAVVFLWTFSNYFTAELSETYKQPFVMTIASCLTFQVYFVFLLIKDPLVYLLQLKERSQSPTGAKTDAEPLPPKPAVSLLSTARIGFNFFILYFLSNFLLNFSLGEAPLTKVSNLISTCGFFTLVIGAATGVESLSTLKMVAVALSLIATMFSVLPDFSVAGRETRAALLALGSAVFYGVYSIYLKWEEDRRPGQQLSMTLLFAFVGLYTMILVLPAILLASSFGWLEVPWPQSWKITVGLAINAIIGGLTPNYLWNVAFALTTPLVVAIGLSFATPLGVLAGFVKDNAVPWTEVMAAAVFILSFIILNLGTLDPLLDKRIDSFLLSFHRKFWPRPSNNLELE
jgi:solute carrier family 35 protein F5